MLSDVSREFWISLLDQINEIAEGNKKLTMFSFEVGCYFAVVIIRRLEVGFELVKMELTKINVEKTEDNVAPTK